MEVACGSPLGGTVEVNGEAGRPESVGQLQTFRHRSGYESNRVEAVSIGEGTDSPNFDEYSSPSTETHGYSGLEDDVLSSLRTRFPFVGVVSFLKELRSSKAHVIRRKENDDCIGGTHAF